MIAKKKCFCCTNILNMDYMEFGMVWVDITFVGHFSYIFFLLLPASDNEEILQTDEIY